MEANPRYVLGQLARALADEKKERWSEVLGGMLSGLLDIGSRTPILGTPAWVTPDVLHGGFVTARFLAGGPMRHHEQALIGRLPTPPGTTPRARINSWYVGDEGFAQLQELLASGRYRIDVPEEGALLTVAWLVREGFVEEARLLLDVIGPWFDRLRFYPRPAAEALPPGGDVHLQPVGKTVQQLEGLTDAKEVLIMRDAIRVWNPLYDRAVALWMETVSGEMPAFRGDAIEGGWPCQVYPSGWPERARALRELGAVPEVVRRALLRSLPMPLATLVQRKVVGSSEALGSVLPQLTSLMRGDGLPSSDVRRLYAAIYEAFRRRRSLLLFELRSQVRLEELPWIARSKRIGSPTRRRAHRRCSMRSCGSRSRRSRTRSSRTSCCRRSARSPLGAGLDLPITAELATDIFQGQFSATFVAAAKRAAALLRGTLYERYYRIPYADVLTMKDAQALVRLCEPPARRSRSHRRSRATARSSSRRRSSPRTTWRRSSTRSA